MVSRTRSARCCQCRCWWCPSSAFQSGSAVLNTGARLAKKADYALIVVVAHTEPALHSPSMLSAAPRSMAMPKARRVRPAPCSASWRGARPAPALRKASEDVVDAAPDRTDALRLLGAASRPTSPAPSRSRGRRARQQPAAATSPGTADLREAWMKLADFAASTMSQTARSSRRHRRHAIHSPPPPPGTGGSAWPTSMLAASIRLPIVRPCPAPGVRSGAIWQDRRGP